MKVSDRKSSLRQCPAAHYSFSPLLFVLVNRRAQTSLCEPQPAATSTGLFTILNCLRHKIQYSIRLKLLLIPLSAPVSSQFPSHEVSNNFFSRCFKLFKLHPNSIDWSRNLC